MTRTMMSVMGIMLLAGCGGTTVLTMMPDSYYAGDYEEIYVDDGSYYDPYYDTYYFDEYDPFYFVDVVTDYVYDEYYYDEYYYDDEYYDDEYYGEDEYYEDDGYYGEEY